MTRLLVALAGLAAALALAACGGSDDAAPATTASPATTAQETTDASTTAPATTEAPATTAAETETAETETTETEAETVPPETKKNDDKRVRAEVRVVGGAPQGGVAKIDAKKGQRVHIEVVVDAPDELHLHGYDLEAEATPAKPGVFDFVAEFEGVFELESHSTDTLIAQVAVRP